MQSPSRRFLSPTCDPDDLEWKWSCCQHGEHIAKVGLWTLNNRIAQLQLTSSRDSKLPPLKLSEQQETLETNPDHEFISNNGFSTLQVSVAPRYAWKLFLSGVEVYDMSFHAKRKPLMTASTPVHVLKAFTPQNCRFVGIGFGMNKSGMIVAIGCEENTALPPPTRSPAAPVQQPPHVGQTAAETSSRNKGGEGGVGVNIATSKNSIVDVTAESVLFLTDSIVLLSLTFAFLLAALHWCLKSKRCNVAA